MVWFTDSIYAVFNIIHSLDSESVGSTSSKRKSYGANEIVEGPKKKVSKQSHKAHGSPAVPRIPSPLGSPAAAQSTTPALLDLRSYGLYVHPGLHVVICTSCSDAIHLEEARSHLAGHRPSQGHPNLKLPKKEQLSHSLRSSGALPKDEITFPTVPVPRITGLKVKDGWLCMKDGCGNITASTRSWYEHAKKNHSPARCSLNSDTTKVSIHTLYGFRGNQVILQVQDTDSQQPQEEPSTNDDAYKR